MYFYTYKITNLSNGKIYIGVHKTENLADGYMGSGSILAKAKQKYGIENFHKDILMFHDTEDDMFEIEALIVDNEFIKRKDVYNVKLGGQGGWDYLNSTGKNLAGVNGYIKKLSDPLFREKLKIARSKHPEFSQETRKLLSKNMSNFIKMNGPLFEGKKHTVETKRKMSEAAKRRTGEKNSQFGKMWIHSLIERRSIRINKDDPIPNGWSKGRKMFK